MAAAAEAVGGLHQAPALRVASRVVGPLLSSEPRVGPGERCGRAVVASDAVMAVRTTLVVCAWLAAAAAAAGDELRAARTAQCRAMCLDEVS